MDATARRPGSARARPTAVPKLGEPWVGLRDAYHELRQRWSVLLGRHDLAVPEYALLEHCARSAARASDLARAIGLTPAGATDVIDRLERRGSVRRVRSSLDRRVVFVQLTPRGTDLYRSAQSTVRAALRALDADLAPAERRALTRGLAALLRTLGRSRTPEG